MKKILFRILMRILVLWLLVASSENIIKSIKNGTPVILLIIFIFFISLIKCIFIVKNKKDVPLAIELSLFIFMFLLCIVYLYKQTQLGKMG
jgi:ABC-type polysaccharide/polyol phosphate export permease